MGRDAPAEARDLVRARVRVKVRVRVRVVKVRVIHRTRRASRGARPGKGKG